MYEIFVTYYIFSESAWDSVPYDTNSSYFTFIYFLWENGDAFVTTTNFNLLKYFLLFQESKKYALYVTFKLFLKKIYIFHVPGEVDMYVKYEHFMGTLSFLDTFLSPKRQKSRF